jgi:magnesium chelatase family protein
MPVAFTAGAVVVGVEGRIVEVEADISPGLPGVTIVGLPDTAVAEARDRARAAVLNSGGHWPSRRITVGLSPASLHKRGSGLDLAIAVAILACSQQVPAEALTGTLLVGELGLDGRIRPVLGAIVLALAAAQAGFRRFVLPAENAGEASLVSELEVVGVRSLADLVAVLHGAEPAAVEMIEPARTAAESPADLADVRGQIFAVEAMVVAAAGGHNVAMVGPAGVGKTMLAERLCGLLPDLADQEAMEVTAIHSIAGRLRPGSGLLRRPPFQAPHHSASQVSLVGGGAGGKPTIGVLTLAHRGMIFLDEAPEFDARVLDALRQPLEAGEVQVARSGFSVRFPTVVQAVIAANQCPCGALRGPGSCTCTPLAKRRYFSRLSGPLLDRFDLRLAIQKPTRADLAASDPVRSTAQAAPQIAAARERARQRFWQAGVPWRRNSEIPGAQLRRSFQAEPRAMKLIERGVETGVLSHRGADRVLRVAWSIADLSGDGMPTKACVEQSLALRSGGEQWRS